MKQAIWRGKEIRKEQSDGSARTQWSVTPVPSPTSGAKGKQKSLFHQETGNLAPSKHNFLNS